MTLLLLEYAVIFTYNFDHYSEVYLFDDDYEAAKKFLKESFEKEVREESGWDNVETMINEDETYAEIKRHTRFGVDICEYRLCTDVRRIEK